ncbi:MAG: class I SAM-dependent methyltransferase, partial [Flavobacteriaceae bacterium]
MKKMVTPYKGSESSKKEQVTKMFDGISKQYDLLNRVISLGIDQSWRRKVVRLAGENKPQRIIDIATGTGDLAIALKTTAAEEIIGLDISPGMLSVGTEKVKKLALDKQISMVLGDGEKLPYPNNYFDV